MDPEVSAILHGLVEIVNKHPKFMAKVVKSSADAARVLRRPEIWILPSDGSRGTQLPLYIIRFVGQYIEVLNDGRNNCARTTIYTSLAYGRRYAKLLSVDIMEPTSIKEIEDLLDVL